MTLLSFGCGICHGRGIVVYQPGKAWQDGHSINGAKEDQPNIHRATRHTHPAVQLPTTACAVLPITAGAAILHPSLGVDLTVHALFHHLCPSRVAPIASQSTTTLSPSIIIAAHLRRWLITHPGPSRLCHSHRHAFGYPPPDLSTRFLESLSAVLHQFPPRILGTSIACLVLPPRIRMLCGTNTTTTNHAPLTTHSIPHILSSFYLLAFT